MTTLKALILFIGIIHFDVGYAQGLGPDFSCKARDAEGVELEVLINNFDFAREVSLKRGSKLCNFKITHGTYLDKSAAPRMLLNLAQKETCYLSKKHLPLEKGFLKVTFQKNFVEAHALVLKGPGPLKCQVETFNKQKLRDRIEINY